MECAPSISSMLSRGSPQRKAESTFESARPTAFNWSRYANTAKRSSRPLHRAGLQVIEEKIEFFVAYGKPVLASHKREPDAQFEEELAEVIEQPALKITLVGIIAEHEKIEAPGIFGDVLRHVGLWRRKSAVKVGNCLSLSMPPAGFDLMNEHVAAPSMLNGGFDVPDAILRDGELFRESGGCGTK